jgi:hypothetical protein
LILTDSRLDFRIRSHTIAATVNRKCYSLAILALLLFVSPANAIVLGQLDDFQDGTTQNWANGEIIGTTPVTNIANGGPGGAGDPYIQLTADGGGSGGKLTAFNRDQWLGDYIAAGVTSIQVDLLNQSAVNLSIRLAFKNGPGSSGVPGYLTQPMLLAVGSAWQHFTISLAPANLTPVGGPAPWNTFFIGEVRFINEVGTSNLSGTPVVGQLGIDNVHAVPEPATIALLGGGMLAFAACRGKFFARATNR